jgi:hypothetical protein
VYEGGVKDNDWKFNEKNRCISLIFGEFPSFNHDLGDGPIITFGGDIRNGI